MCKQCLSQNPVLVYTCTYFILIMIGQILLIKLGSNLFLESTSTEQLDIVYLKSNRQFTDYNLTC